MTTSFSPDLLVADVAKASRFLQAALGFKEVDRAGPLGEPVWALLMRDNQRVMVEKHDGHDHDSREVVARAGGKLGATVHFYMSVDDLEPEILRLRGAGVAFKGPTTQPYGMREVRFRDPDGYSWMVGQRTAR
jgi:catechol 2,3-dioxygenase-like lactoylglutathione lyase family enzyme